MLLVLALLRNYLQIINGYGCPEPRIFWRNGNNFVRQACIDESELQEFNLASISLTESFDCSIGIEENNQIVTVAIHFSYYIYRYDGMRTIFRSRVLPKRSQDLSFASNPTPVRCLENIISVRS